MAFVVNNNTVQWNGGCAINDTFGDFRGLYSATAGMQMYFVASGGWVVLVVLEWGRGIWLDSVVGNRITPEYHIMYVWRCSSCLHCHVQMNYLLGSFGSVFRSHSGLNLDYGIKTTLYDYKLILKGHYVVAFLSKCGWEFNIYRYFY